MGVFNSLNQIIINYLIDSFIPIKETTD